MSYGGLYRAVCIQNVDPEGRYRIKVQCATIFGEGESTWALPCLPPGWFEGLTSNHSFTDNADVNTTETLTHSLKRTVPSVGEPVWVMFEAGQAEKPVWMGTWRANG